MPTESMCAPARTFVELLPRWVDLHHVEDILRRSQQPHKAPGKKRESATTHSRCCAPSVCNPSPETPTSSSPLLAPLTTPPPRMQEAGGSRPVLPHYRPLRRHSAAQRRPFLRFAVPPAGFAQRIKEARAGAPPAPVRGMSPLLEYCTGTRLGIDPFRALAGGHARKTHGRCRLRALPGAMPRASRGAHTADEQTAGTSSRTSTTRFSRGAAA